MRDTSTRPAAAGDPLSETPTHWERIEHHTRTLDRAVRLTQLADGKVAPVLALHVSLAAITVSQSGDLGHILTGDAASWGRSAVAWVLLALYVTASLASFREVALIYIPATPRRGGRYRPGHSIFYYDDIQRMSVDEFHERSTTHVDLAAWEADVIRQTHMVSEVVARKFLGVQRAYVVSAITLAAWLPLVVVIRI